MNIREWTYNDAQDIASVQVESWRTTYKGIIPDDYLNNLNISERTRKWEDILTHRDQKVFIAMKWRSIIGFATCGKSEELVQYDSTLSSIYLLGK